MNEQNYQKNKLCIIVLGYIIRGPLGGLTWHHLQYVMSLAALGYEVYYLEDSDDYESCYDPSKHQTTADPTFGINYAKNVFERVGLGHIWSYYDAHNASWSGPCSERIDQILNRTDILLNISGVNPIRPWFQDIPNRVLIDTDPAFTQIKHLKDPKKNTAAKMHTAFFSFGEQVSKEECKIPNDGFNWLPTRQPVALDAWKVIPGPPDGKFTTVMQWDSYSKKEYDGVEFGLKSKTFEDYMELPSHTKEKLELALGTKHAPKELLRSKGWIINDPLKVTEDPWIYQKYIRDSKAEFSIAKHGYVVSNSGWFSERSAAYLASGRPVVVQETGFSDFIPTGKGLLSFSTPEEAIEGIKAINTDYQLHCKYAREIAEEYFDSAKVLKSMLDRI